MTARGFRYFEHVDEAANRFLFWEIAIDGPALEQRHGPVGTPGKHELEMCASEQHARREYDHRIAEKQADGYQECADRRLDARTRALEDAIEASPDDVATYLVYADWIQTLGDPRGALIVAQAAARSDADAARRADAYLAEHAALFLGPLADHVGYDGALVSLDWRCGFIERARLSAHDVWTARPSRILEELLAHPSARWLTTLSIDVSQTSDSIQLLVNALARHPSMMLRVLALGEIGWTDEDYDPVTRPGQADLSRLWPAFPRIRYLVLRGDSHRLGALELPELEHLALHTRELSRATAIAIAASGSPITRLDLRFRTVGELAEQLRPIFDGSLVRRLDHLAITGGSDTDELCRAIAGLRRPSLCELDLSGGSMTDDGARTLADSGLTLEIIDVTRNRLTRNGITLLWRIAKLVIAEEQQPRY